MTVVVGVDGGQSTIRVRLSGEAASRTAPGLSHLESDTETSMVDCLADLLGSAVGSIDRVVAGLSTVPATKSQAHELCVQLADRLDAPEVWITGDDVTSHAGAFGGSGGVVLSVGTGVACLALNASTGELRSFDGAGYLVGDEGGGFWIGSAAVRAVIAAHELRGPQTTLTAAVAARLGPIKGLGVRLHTGDSAVNTIAQTAPDVLAEAQTGDPVAVSILDDAGDRLAQTAVAALNFVGPDCSLVLDGQLVAAGSRLAQLIEAGVARQLSGCTVRYQERTSLDGALALASSGSLGPYSGLITTYRSAT